MTRTALSIRCMLATGLVVSVLICCCQGESLGRAFTRLVETGSVVASSEVVSCCASSESDEQSMPDDDGRPCDCRTRIKAKNLADAKPAVDLAGTAPIVPMLVARVEPVPLAVVRVPAFDGRVPEWPPTSLLRQHCALII